MSRNSGPLSEQYVQDSFHRYLKSSLTQAKVEHLLDAELLSSAESDLMITGMFQACSLIRVYGGYKAQHCVFTLLR